MELSFSRGFSPGWLGGCDHKMLVPGLSSAKHGVLVGRVRGSRGQRVEVELCGSLKRGDGIVFEGNRSEGQEQGGRIYEIFQHGHSLKERVAAGCVELTFAHGSIDFDRFYPDQCLWKTDEPDLTHALRKTYRGQQPQRRLPVDLEVEAAVGRPLSIVARSGGASLRLESPQPLAEAIRHALSAEVLREQLGRLGGTHYELAGLEARIIGRPMIPLSVLGKLRHALVERLDASLGDRPRRACSHQPALESLRRTLPMADAGPVDASPALNVHCRSLAQLQAVLDCGIRSTSVDFQDIRVYAQAVDLAHSAGAEILLATPRIQKPDELGIFRALGRHGSDGILARNLAGLDFFVRAGVPVVADFSLNVTNELAAQYLISLGARRVTASYDSNRDQLMELAAAVPPAWLEVVVHQHMPMFHMEHCVFCAVLSPGTNKTNCGRPCDVHEVKLRDRIGMEHPLKADVGCRNTLYNAVPQSAAEAIPALLNRGLRHFRIELLDDAPAPKIAETVELYRGLLAGRLSGKQVWSRLNAANRVGVTRGTLEERRNPLAII